MGSTLPFIFALFTVAIVAIHAALTPEQYWNKVLPATSMPKAIIDSLNAEFVQNKSTSVAIGMGDQGNIRSCNIGRCHNCDAAPECDPKVAYFFLEADLVPGKTFNWHFIKTAGLASFLPREMADSIAFSSHNITKNFNRFSIDPQSEEANIMRETIRECETRGPSGEQKYCATSLESMIDFCTKILGKKNVKVVSTRFDEDTQIKKYTIEGNVNRLTRDEETDALAVVCHKKAYVYAVFYCHFSRPTKVYMGPLKSENGTEVMAVAVCHEDMKLYWNPKHFAFQMTKVKPGTVPICHFLSIDALVWYRN